jgi:glyoxylase-like metal-dependent hydrolase (beta-lactamase superfamily II)/alkylhydroperoxidase family enzyme
MTRPAVHDSQQVPFTRGWHQLGDHTRAWLEPQGGWGEANAGLVSSEGRALQVDTLFDLPHAQFMRDELARELPQVVIDTVVNTHADPDHCWGNQLFPEAAITVSERTASEMAHGHRPGPFQDLLADNHNPALRRYLRELNAGFTFAGITLPSPRRTFSGTLDVVVGDVTVRLIDIGPAHTEGDTIVWVPQDRVLYAGDLLFSGVHPVMWGGTIENWIAACRAMEELRPRVVVPGHGPVTDVRGIADFRAYLEYVGIQVRRRFDAGMPWQEAAADIPLDRWAAWGSPERIAVTIATIYHDLGKTPRIPFEAVVAAQAAIADGTQRRARIAPSRPAEWDQRTADLLRPAPSGGALVQRLAEHPALNLLAVMARHPDLFATWMPLAMRITDGLLPPVDRELVTLRTALRCGSGYEWDQHASVGLSVGLTTADLDRIVNGPADLGWSPLQRALLRCVDELHAQSTISDATWRELAEHYDERQLIELVLLVGHYHEVAFVLNGLRVPPDPWGGPSTFPGVPAA